MASKTEPKCQSNRSGAGSDRTLGKLSAPEVPDHGVFATAERDKVFSTIERILGFAPNRVHRGNGPRITC